jgi:hypothetical protein
MAVRIRLFRVASLVDAGAPIGAFSAEMPVSGSKNRGMILFGENKGTVRMMAETGLIQADVRRCLFPCGKFGGIRDVRLSRFGLLGGLLVAMILEMKLKMQSVDGSHVFTLGRLEF